MSVKISDIGKAVLETEYAVRGPIVARAQELERDGRAVIYCNIGNPQALGQAPLSWTRRILALCEYPTLAIEAPGSFPTDAVAAARALLAGSKHGIGAYSESKGLKVVRDAVASFITRRDGIAADPDAIFLTDGASKGVQAALRLMLAGPDDGIMIPIPQYPLYSATITMYEGRQVGYYLDEERDWAVSRELLENAIAGAKEAGVRTKAIVVINPGNPTGSVLRPDNVKMVIDFAKKHGLAILADEVYQDNVYRDGERFESFAKAMAELGEKDVSLFSFHSTSKGFLGECGQRGGYMEVRNVTPDVMAQILKMQSVSLCANLPGQAAMYSLVSPPPPDGPSKAEYDGERAAILGELKARARLLADGLNAIPGFRCNEVAGAMYAFPRLTLPAGRTDEEWCMALLEKTGICVVPGSGFGQLPGTAHFRTTILPPREKLAEVVKAIAAFNAEYR
ncbi:MAG: aminotransferase class I/II [Spirochaetae bacterium HGW-Spirochaetae-3]|jgi:aspartate/methionine/tyrosine aminotransferase|nr:MAG: aminotransferase class I/II [Spirochaetae bacterium HGW-Spirochaetae-3]